MVELIVLEYLTEALAVPAYMEEPENPGESYVVIEKTGGFVSNHIETATIAVQSYGATLYDAAVLNETVKQALAGIDSLDDIGGVEIGSDYNFTDPTTKRYRYQCLSTITYSYGRI